MHHMQATLVQPSTPLTDYHAIIAYAQRLYDEEKLSTTPRMI